MFIENILNSFTTQETNEFISFLGRKQKKQGRKDAEVCKQILNNNEISKNNNHYAIRHRIKNELIKYVSLKQVELDPSETSHMLNSINMCSYLLDNRLLKEGWDMLNKLELRAQDSKNYTVLSAIYPLMLQHANSSYAQDVQTIIEKRKLVKQFLDEEENLIEILAIVRSELHNYKLDGATNKLDTINAQLESFLQYNEDTLCKHPRQLRAYLESLRAVSLIEKESRKLTKSFKRLYEKAKSLNSFAKNSHGEKLKILYMLCHALYRDKQFDETLKYLAEFEQSIDVYKQSHFHFYYAKVSALRSALNFLNGELQLAIQDAETTLENTSGISLKDNLNMHLNLAVYYSYNNEFRKANKIFVNFHHTDFWVEKRMGKEWLVRMKLIYLLIQYQMGNDDIALNILNSIIRATSDFEQLSQDKQFTRFLKLFKHYLEDQTSVTEEQLSISFENKMESVNTDDEVKKLAFYCWFKALVAKQAFYTVLIKHMKSYSQA